MVARGGIEPPTQRFSVFRSTTELPGHTIFSLSSAAADYQATQIVVEILKQIYRWGKSINLDKI